jgi:PAS domain-containing protein
VEGRYRRKDGSLLEVESSRRAVRTAQGDMVVAVARDITARKRDESLLHLEHAVTGCIAEAADSAAAVKEVIRAMCESEHWECGDYWWFDERHGVRRLLYSWGVEDPAIQRFIEQSRGMVLPAAEGNVGRVLASGRPLWKADMESDTVGARARIAREAGMHALFVLPIVSGGKVFAAITFNSRQRREPDDRFLRAARVIGSQVGQFLQRKHAEEVLRESEERFRGLTQLSSDMYWEQDERFRFTRFEGIGSKRLSQASASYVGKKRAVRQHHAAGLGRPYRAAGGPPAVPRPGAVPAG